GEQRDRRRGHATGNGAFHGVPLLERRVWEPLWQNVDRVSCAQQRAASRPDGAQPHRPPLRARAVAREQHHASRAWPVRSTVAIVSASSARLSGRLRTTRAKRSATPPGYCGLACTLLKANSITSSVRTNKVLSSRTC